MTTEQLPNPTYIVDGALSANIVGPAVRLRNTQGCLKMRITTTATGTPRGTFSLQGSDDLTNWDEIPGTAAQLPFPGFLAAQTRVCAWERVNFEYARLVWTVLSGGSGATLNVQSRVL